MKNIYLLDGGIGQELVKRSAFPPSPMWSAQVLMDEPEIVEAVHRDFIKSGARTITLNTYSLTPERIERDGELGSFQKLQARAIEIAKKARDESGEDVAIAGCLPPLVASYRPDLAPEYQICVDTYRQIVEQQRDHVDLFLCETLASDMEIRAATCAGVESGKPVWTAVTISDDKDQNEKRRW